MAKAPKDHNLIDPAKRKEFIEKRDHWEQLNSRANSATGKRRQFEKEIKTAGFKMSQIKTSLLCATPEGEAELRARLADDLLAAAYSGSDIGDQLSAFLEPDRTPATDRAAKEGETDAMQNKAANPKYDPSTAQATAYMESYHREQERQVKAGISKLDAKAGNGKAAGKAQKAAKTAKAGKTPKAAAESKPPGRRGRPPGSGKGAAPKDDAPPRKPSAAPATRASLAAERAKADAPDDAASYFSKSETAGNA